VATCSACEEQTDLPAGNSKGTPKTVMPREARRTGGVPILVATGVPKLKM
jgi:hypothetical protein